MNVVVEDEVVFVHILRAGAVAAEEDAASAQVLDVVAGDRVLLRMQVHANGAAATVSEVTILDLTTFGTA